MISGADSKAKLPPPIEYALEEMIPYMQPDEMVEVTPSVLRLRKQVCVCVCVRCACARARGVLVCCVCVCVCVCVCAFTSFAARSLTCSLTDVFALFQYLDSNERKKMTKTKTA